MGTLSTACAHCQHDRSLLDVVWQLKRGRLWQAYLICTHCDLGTGFLLEPRNDGALSHGPQGLKGGINSYFKIIRAWPEPHQLVAPEFTPQAVAKRYIEGEDAFARSRWNSAVAMYRSALDIATKGMEGVPAGKTFFKRLEWMFENNLITDNIREWADQVRVEGNDALHEPDEFDEQDAASLRYFTEMFLIYVFEMPGRVAEFRNRDAVKEEESSAADMG